MLTKCINETCNPALRGGRLAVFNATFVTRHARDSRTENLTILFLFFSTGFSTPASENGVPVAEVPEEDAASASAAA